MLRKGQRVQIIKTAYITVDSKEVLSKHAGKITTVTGFAYSGDTPDRKPEDYYNIACTDRTIARGCLMPIDDEGCDDAFLEDFKQLIKEKEDV